ncbi:cysteine-rich receptor-like protein kinase 7 [Silene latifolia]|uniref:cysteine-rich receptor-like protein kinase 7 n=1 Tax=Silene latifolia TaxID=37657 RepID=UPI003D782982
MTTAITGFNQVLLSILDEGANQAANGPVDKMIATREGIFADNLMSLNTIYKLLECSPDITLNNCKNCLQATISNIRYDTNPFYGDALVDSSTPSPSPISKEVKFQKSNGASNVIGKFGAGKWKFALFLSPEKAELVVDVGVAIDVGRKWGLMINQWKGCGERTV